MMRFPFKPLGEKVQKLAGAASSASQFFDLAARVIGRYENNVYAARHAYKAVFGELDIPASKRQRAQRMMQLHEYAYLRDIGVQRTEALALLEIGRGDEHAHFGD